MQYQFVLPADYPMDSIENRIQEKGHLLDGYTGLLYKAYLYSRKEDSNYNSKVNSYAPFYIWKDIRAMTHFLQSAAFKTLCDQFGRPRVQTWLLNTPPLSRIKRLYLPVLVTLVKLNAMYLGLIAKAGKHYTSNG